LKAQGRASTPQAKVFTPTGDVFLEQLYLRLSALSMLANFGVCLTATRMLQVVAASCQARASVGKANGLTSTFKRGLHSFAASAAESPPSSSKAAAKSEVTVLRMSTPSTNPLSGGNLPQGNMEVRQPLLFCCAG
jgi:hypothetical protein